MPTQVTIKNVSPGTPWSNDFGTLVRKKNRVAVDAETGCWNWLLYRHHVGHGTVSVAGKKVYAHRWYWEQVNGPVPEGLELDHLCRNPACVNPDHLEAVTHAENIQRGRTARLTWDDVRAIRASRKTGGELEREYGLSVGHVSRIRRGEIWKEVSA